MARVFLVYFDINTGFYPGLNHGLASLSAAIRQNGHTLKFHHLHKEEPPQSLSDIIIRFKPDIVGFSLTTNQRMFLKKYSQSIYARCEVLQVAGGAHATVDPMDILVNVNSIQGVCIGEGELTLPALLKKLDRGEPVSDTAGFWWRTDEGTIKRNPVPPLEPDLSKLPYPDYSIFNVDEINKAHGDQMAMSITRGCPYDCWHCSNYALGSVYPNKKDFVRVPPVKHAIRLVKNNLACYPNVKGIFFADELLTWNKEWFKEFSEQYRQEINLPFVCSGRVELLTEYTCLALKRAGCVIVQIGVESGSEWLREYLLNRRMSNNQIVKAFRLLKDFGIQRFAFNIVGFPFETKELMHETLSLIKRIKPELGLVTYFFPYPGTRLYSICKEFGLLSKTAGTLSGLFEGPAIKLTHCKASDCKKIYYKLRLYLMARVATKNLRFASSFISVWVCLLFKIHPSFFVNLSTKRSRLHYMFRRIVYKNILVNNQI